MKQSLLLQNSESQSDCLHVSTSEAERNEAIQVPEAGGNSGAGKRKRRFVFLVTTVVPAILLLASCVLWIRSYWANDYLVYGVARPAPKICEQWGVVSNRGICRIGWQEGDLVVEMGLSHTRGTTFAWTDLATFWKRAGFNYEAKDNFKFAGRHCDYRIIAIPYWSFAGVLTLIIAIPNRKSPKAQRLFERLAAL